MFGGVNVLLGCAVVFAGKSRKTAKVAKKRRKARKEISAYDALRPDG